MKKINFVLAGAGILIIFLSIIFTIQLENEVVIPNQTEIIPVNPTPVLLDKSNPIKVGILHSLSGTMAISETPVVDATLLAIDEINERGGIMGREVVPIIVDGKSDWLTFAQEAEMLIVEEEVSAVFGGWTSASRKTMLPIFEKYNHLLFYPVQYEGLEQSPNIIYTGAAPNQQVIPAVDWAFENLGTKFFLVGSDYVFPRSANEIIKNRISELGGEVVGEEYRLLGDTDFEKIHEQIEKTQPEVILNTINGDSNIAFFEVIHEIHTDHMPIHSISFSIGENEIQQMGTKNLQNDYAAWNYFQSLQTIQNENFVNSFKNKFGEHRVTSDPMEAAYIGVYLFAKAVEKSGSDKPSAILESLKGMSFLAPEGVVGIDPENQHLLKGVRIGKIQPDGQFEIVFSTEESISPEPYPAYQSEEEWNTFLDNLYSSWGENWSNPG